ncbi:hypothetical protein BJ878DRAFT_284400 [Calycina marina]|uniref:2EXR domain-containing protein n=1 Tax=Calycina marina TaxID=1763456 RepID=A0A9P7YWG7_9HELO|nr:hypothetical protein BJ878DRAFT_284400 [Calycina marina]
MKASISHDHLAKTSEICTSQRKRITSVMSRAQVLLRGLAPLGIPAGPIVKRCPQNFPQFQRLPKELRDKIWKLTCQETREVRLMLHEGSHDLSRTNSCVEGQRNVPNVLHVSTEARQEALKHYAPVLEKPRYRLRTNFNHSARHFRTLNDFRSNRWVGQYQAKQAKMVYINFEVDMFMQQPMMTKFRRIRGSGFNFHVAHLLRIKHLTLYHYQPRHRTDFNVITSIVPYIQLRSLVFDIHNWQSNAQSGHEERLDMHLELDKAKKEFDVLLEQLKNIDVKSLYRDWKMPEDVKLLWESEEEMDLSAWSSDVAQFSQSDRALQPTWH